MYRIRKFLMVTGAVFALAATLNAADSEIARSENIEAQLVTDVNAVQPGEDITVALRMKMDPQWHTYWRNVGDSGLPVEIAWTLPDGFSAGEIQWPYPERIEAGPLVSFGYHGEIFLLNKISVPDELTAEAVTINARADWLECADVCIPGGVDLSLSLAVSREPVEPDVKWVEAFADTRAKLPLKDSGWSFGAKKGDGKYVLQASAPEWYDTSPGEVLYFPYESGVIDYAAKQKVNFENGVLALEVAVAPMPGEEPHDLEGVLVAENGWRGAGSEKAIHFDAEPGSSPGAASATGKKESSLLLVLLGAFVGGMILNLMPCVLPVLSLKIMGFVQQANEEKSKPWQHGLVFTGGVLISFWVLAGALLLLRAGGEELGWGFQLQSPIFLIVLSAFLFLFGLSMFGLFEIGTSLTTLQGGKPKGGFGGSFVSGVMATVVATPCTAPFMGSALGFALTQPAWVSLTVFSFLGLGMASPYVLLASTPALLKFVPKPGRWMESLKQFMGFLLLATVLWLLWVLAQQAGAMMVIVTLGALLLLGLAGWIYGRWGNLAMGTRTRAVATSIAALIVVASLYITIDSVDTFAAAPQASGQKQTSGIVWEDYNESRYQELKQSDKPVFIDFTAAWCLSCQVNDRVAFSSEKVQQKFKDMGMVSIKADWTSRDDMITRALARYGRNSVPLYVYYPSGTDSEPQILPEIITPGIVLDALENGSPKAITRK